MSAPSALLEVPWLAPLGPAVALEVAGLSERHLFAPGAPIVAELEIGDSIYILVEGAARVTVSAGGEQVREVGMLGPGDAFGELSLLTGELRSATVTAVDTVTALRLEPRAFEGLVARHPAIAGHFTRVMARRLVATRAALDALLRGPAGHRDGEVAALAGHAAAARRERGSIGRAWRELVLAGRRELPVVALGSFVLSLGAVRSLAWALERSGVSLFGFLRAAYTAGFLLLIASTATSLSRFRPSWQRWIAAAFGMGTALILNELSVFLAFDVFYLDMTTRDANMVFNVETLYRRTESVWATALMAAFLLQLALLRRFYRRAAFILRVRLARLLAGRG